MTHLLDTDHASLLEQGHGPDYAALVGNLSQHSVAEVGLSVVTVHEQFRGCHNRINQADTADKVVRAYNLLFRVIDKFRHFPIVAFDTIAAATFDELKVRKVRVPTMDLRIASTALARNLTLVTRNVSDFSKVPGLRTEDWTK